MAEEPPAEAAGHAPALDVQAGFGMFHIRIKIDNPWLAAGFLGAGILTLRAFYNSNPEPVETAVRTALAGLADRVLNIRPASILVEFVCYTKDTLLAFMDAFATGRVKQRLQEEFFKIGFKDKLEVTVTVYDIESEMRKEMWETSSDFGAASESSAMSSDVESMESGCITLYNF
ncbi:uncharacterized protein LOC110057805 [Orbicella faveolata]|uniref:uncharacterized protein LOC110057805 n=1 Tax=Orbicella faveolata TaxID=48498 RepID=UPI0009E52712|nr:uncharacterized protein LOC110057805 [Orbicella faveolata]